MKHRLILLVAMFLALPFVADAQTYHFTAVAPTGQTLYYYRVNDHEVYVARQNTSWPYYDTPPSGALTIPATVRDGSTIYDVTGVAAYAFYQCTTLTAINLPTSIRVIGSNAFYQCYGFTSIVIPNGVTTIGENAFYDCYQATSLSIPNTVTSIGDYAFAHCIGVTSLNIPNSLTSIGVGVFANCCGLTSINIPNSVTTIMNSAFSGCSGLTSINIPNSVTTIGTFAFYGCSNATTITLPNSITTIDNHVFNDCTSLTSINIPSSVTTIGHNAFNGCRSLTSLSLPNTITSIGSLCFNNCRSLTSINIPTSLSTIQNATFWNCTALTSITIPSSVTYIEGFAFNGCTGLRSIECQRVAPPNVENGYTFMDVPTNIPVHVPCGSLADYQGAIIWSNFTNLTDFPYNVTVNSNDDSYGTATASLNCATSTVTLTATPNCGYRFVRWANSSDETVSNDATYSFTATGDVVLTAEFSDRIPLVCSSGQTLIFTIDCDNNTASIVGHGDCTGELFIPALIDVGGNNYTVTTIDYQAFIHCEGLVSVSMGDNITHIDNLAFWGCNGLTSLVIGPSVTEIGDGAFYNNSSLTQIFSFAETPPTIGSVTFYGVPTTTPINVPCGTVAAYQAAEGWSSFTNIQELASCQHTVTVNSNDESWGTVSGGGTYTIGTEISLTTTPADGFVFQQWHDGNTDNPRSLTVTEDATLTAYFAPASVSSTGVSISVDGDAIVVDGANGNTVTLYDNNGNLLDSQHSAVGTPLRLESMSSGTYYVKIGAIPARMKVIVN